MAGRKRDDALDRVTEAMERGLTLRFESPDFAEKLRPRGTGPVYKTDAVLRAVRLNRARIVSDRVGPFTEIECRPAVARTQLALQEEVAGGQVR